MRVPCFELRCCLLVLVKRVFVCDELFSKAVCVWNCRIILCGESDFGLWFRVQSHVTLVSVGKSLLPVRSCLTFVTASHATGTKIFASFHVGLLNKSWYCIHPQIHPHLPITLTYLPSTMGVLQLIVQWITQDFMAWNLPTLRFTQRCSRMFISYTNDACELNMF